MCEYDEDFKSENEYLKKQVKTCLLLWHLRELVDTVRGKNL